MFRTYSEGSFVISCTFLVKAKTHLILKEYVITFEKIRVPFSLHSKGKKSKMASKMATICTKF